jgi:amidase
VPRVPRYSFRFEEATIGELQARMESGRLTSRALVRAYRRRIETVDRPGPGKVGLRAVLERNPDAEKIAAALDAERRRDGARGPLHGIPVLVKDNMDTADRLHTTAGSLALVGSRPKRDATVVERLRAAGAVILGKTNLSEWSNIRSPRSSSGWSGRGGQTRNPYALDCSPSGSSSGSAAAVSANLAAATLGTETDGSIVCPAAACNVVGIKPTVGLTSRAGVIPIAHSQDTVGPICRTVADAATVLGALVGPDPRDPATADSEARVERDYRPFLDASGLHGARIGIPREVFYEYSPPASRVAEEAIEALRAAGAEVVDPANIPGAKEMAGFTAERELEVLLYELKHDLDAYLAERGDPRIRSLADVIAFNREHAGTELRHFGQEFFEAAQSKGPLTDESYLEALASNRRQSREEGVDKVLGELRLDALMVPTSTPPWTIDLVNGDHVLGEGSTPAALAGYPAVSVPAGYADGLPVGMTFFGTAWSEPTLIRLAYAFEQATKVRRPPRFRSGGPSPTGRP